METSTRGKLMRTRRTGMVSTGSSPKKKKSLSMKAALKMIDVKAMASLC